VNNLNQSNTYLTILHYDLYAQSEVCSPTQEQGDKPFMVTNVNSLRDLSGCNVINGSLEISLKGGSKCTESFEPQSPHTTRHNLTKLFFFFHRKRPQ